MTIKRRRVEGLIAANPQDFTAVGLGAKYARLVGIRARNWASSAKAGAGTDTAVKIRLTDNNGDVVFLDAADRDYATAEVTLQVNGVDDTTTGLGVTGVDATGAAIGASEGAAGGPIMESPVTVRIVNGTTATDYMTVDLMVEV